MRATCSAVVIAIVLALGCQEQVELDPGAALCAPIGETCVAGPACCSHVCADDGSGMRVCQALGGCFPPGEVCRHGSECCNQACVAGRCADAESCASLGEVCAVSGDPSATRACCASAGSDPQCHATPAGIDRCRSRGMPMCSDPGAPCRTPEDCCSTVCVDTGMASLTCEAACRDTDESCTRSADCCTGTCHGGLCTGDRACEPLGATCAASADCCSGTCIGTLCQAPPM